MEEDVGRGSVLIRARTEALYSVNTVVVVGIGTLFLPALLKSGD